MGIIWAVRCSVLQYVAVCCSVLQCVAVCGSVLQYAAAVTVLSLNLTVYHKGSMWRCVAVCCSGLR